MATTAHGLTYPDDYSDKADVPTTLQLMVESIEVALTAQDTERANLITQSQASGPMGMIVAFGGTAAPTGWKVCDGTAHGQAVGSPLYTLLGGPNVPDLRNRFVVGVGSSYARGATGGADTVTLTAAQSGTTAHNHPGSSQSDNTDHYHAGTTYGATVGHAHYVNLGGGEHNHLYYGSQNLVDMDAAGSGWNVPSHTADYLSGGGHGHAGWSGGADSDHGHTFDTGGRSAFHQHVITVSNSTAANAASAHENRPPYYALTYIIKVV